MNRISVLVTVIILLQNKASCQGCFVLPIDTIFMTNDRVIDSVNKIIERDTSNKYYLILYRSFNQVKRKEAYYLEIDSNGTSRTFVIKDKMLCASNYNENIISLNDLNNIKTTGYYQGFCKNSVSYNESVWLCFLNKGKMYLGFFSIDGNLTGELKSDKKMSLVNIIYDKIKAHFSQIYHIVFND